MRVLRPWPWSGLPGAVALLALILVVQAILVRRSGNAHSMPDLVAGIAIAATVWLWWRRRLVIDDQRVRLFEYRGSRELPRHSIVNIELSGKRWRLSTHDGRELELSDGWSNTQVRRIIEELGLPEPAVMQVGKPERVIREGAWGAVVFALVLLGGLFGLVAWQRGLPAKAVWALCGFAAILVAGIVRSTYTHRIIVGEQGVLVMLGGGDRFVARREQISKVRLQATIGYLIDGASRRRSLGRRSEKELKQLAQALGVPFEQSP